MKPKKLLIRIILYVLYVISIVIMLSDIRTEKTEAHLLYILCNGVLVFRLLGYWFFPWLLHLSCLAYVGYFLGTLKFEYVNTFNTLTVIVPIVIQTMASLHFVLFRPGRTLSQRACRIGVHAQLGLMLIVEYYWVLCYLIKDNDYQCICEMAYMVVFLFMMLIPQFMTKGQIVAQARIERHRLLRQMAQQVPPKLASKIKPTSKLKPTTKLKSTTKLKPTTHR